MMDSIEVGAELPSITKPMSQGMINAWAAVSGDTNPLHVDPEFAKTTRFGGTIAHGHISLGFLLEMLVRWVGPAWHSGGALRRIRFVAPVRPGDTVRTIGKVTDVVVVDGARIANCDVSIVNADTGETCVVGEATFALSG